MKHQFKQDGHDIQDLRKVGICIVIIPPHILIILSILLNYYGVLYALCR